MTAMPTDQGAECATLAKNLAAYWHIEDSWSADDEQSFQRLFDDAPLGVFRVRPEGTIHDSNERAAEMLGYPRRELIGKPLASMQPRSERGSKKAAELFSRFRAGEGFCSELIEMNHGSGRVVEVLLCVTPLLDGDGKLREGISTIREPEAPRPVEH